MPYKDPVKRAKQKAVWAQTHRTNVNASNQKYKLTPKGRASTKRHNHTLAAVRRREENYYQSNYNMAALEARTYKASIGACQICQSTRDLVIDHIHGTKIVRGVLCDKCNKAIGLLGDTKEGVERALAYFICLT